jgi:catechol 2,3-dioxygenase
MSDNPTTPSHGFKIHQGARIGSVSLNVSDIDRSADFYETTLGFKKLNSPSNERVFFSVDGHPSYLVELLQVEGAEESGFNRYGSEIMKRAGLYHFAILLPERKYLADMLQNLSKRRGDIQFDGMADHLVSESLYIRDPDNIGIEIYCDKPPLQWKWSGGQVRMATVRLDAEDLLRESTGSTWKYMPSNTIIGHVHLHVRNLAGAIEYYRDTLGLNHTASYPGAYFFAADRYHHHIATNIWLGSNIQPASSRYLVGLNHFTIELSNKEEYEKTLLQLKEYKTDDLLDVQSNGSNCTFFRDKDGITMKLSTE